MGTEDSSGGDPFTKNPFVYIVAGTDRTFGGLLNLNVQYLYRHVLDGPHRAGESRGFRIGRGDAAGDSQQPDPPLSARRVAPPVVYKWLHETLEAECAAAGYAGPRGAVVQPKVAYAVTDDWKVLARRSNLSAAKRRRSLA